MDNTLLMQLLVSFFVGGTIVAILSFAAEKANKKISGLILTFPSTVGIGLFFMAWVTSSNDTANIIPTVLAPFGVTIFSAPMYIYTANFLSKHRYNKSVEVLISLVITTIIWFIAAATVAELEIKNLFIGVITYFVFISLSHLALNRHTYNKPKPFVYSTVQKIMRAIFMGSIFAIIVFLSKVVSQYWGAVIIAFPAVFFSSMLMFHWVYDAKSLYPIMQKAALGSLSIFVYMLAVMYTFPIFGFIYGTLISYTASLVATLLLIHIQKYL